MATNKRNTYCCEQCFHLGPPEDSYREDAVQFSQSARCLGPVNTYSSSSSRSMFCKSQCNQQQEQVGEDFSGNQPDELSGVIGLH
jgi:hypothetical protein